MELLGSTKNYADQEQDEEDVIKLEFVEVILVHFNLVNCNY